MRAVGCASSFLVISNLLCSKTSVVGFSRRILVFIIRSHFGSNCEALEVQAVGGSRWPAMPVVKKSGRHAPGSRAGKSDGRLTKKAADKLRASAATALARVSELDAKIILMNSEDLRAMTEASHKIARDSQAQTTEALRQTSVAERDAEAAIAKATAAQSTITALQTSLSEVKAELLRYTRSPSPPSWHEEEH